MDTGSTPQKKRKRIAVSVQKFKPEYTKQFAFIKKSRLGETHAFCDACSADFSVAHAGLFDVKKHITTDKHKRYEESRSVPKISTFFTADKDLQVIRAEILFTSFLIEHNVPLAVTEHVGPLFRKMFPDSNRSKVCLLTNEDGTNRESSGK